MRPLVVFISQVLLLLSITQVQALSISNDPIKPVTSDISLIPPTSTPTPSTTQFPTSVLTSTPGDNMDEASPSPSLVNDQDQPLDQNNQPAPTVILPQSIEEKAGFDVKEVVGIGLVIFLVMVIVFQSKSGDKKDPPVTT